MAGIQTNGSATLDQLRAEKVRETRVRADLLGLQHQQQAGALITVEQAQEMVGATFGPVRQALMILPSSMAARCNPSDPALARAALGEWVESVLKNVRENIVPAALRRKRGAPRKPKSR